jgi:hypothetical protein
LIRRAGIAVFDFDIGFDSRTDKRAFVMCRGCPVFFRHGDGDESVSILALKLSPGTFSKSRRLAVSNRASLASEIAEILRSGVA